MNALKSRIGKRKTQKACFLGFLDFDSFKVFSKWDFEEGH